MRWSRLALGVLLGVGAGLLYAWVIDPVQYTDTAPLSMSADDRAAQVELIAEAYLADGDAARARQRLSDLGEAGSLQSLTAHTQQAAASGRDTHTVRALAALAAALGAGPGDVPPTPNPTRTARPTATLEPSPTIPPTITPIQLPTRVPTATPLGAFTFVGKQLICESPPLAAPLLQVIAQDSAGNPLPGVEVLVEWGGGFDRFFTGLKPERGIGYGDFEMRAGIDYTVRLASDPSNAVTGLRAESCPGEAGSAFPGAWQLIFRQ